MREKSIKKNFIFNLIYQILVLVVPLIVTPYVSRVLGVDGVGEYSYANSIVSYFVLFAVLGTSTYGQRAIGYTQKTKEDRSRAFWEVFIFRIITGIITLVIYGGYLFIFVKQASFTVYAILALNIVNVMVDVSWFMQGMEEFDKTATTSIFFKILNLVCVFVFVKQATDLWKYVLISVGFTVLGNICMWIFLPKNLCKVSGIRPFRDIKGIIQLFLPTIATQIYLVLDKSMIGWFSDGYTENGYYEQADKIVKMALTVVTALGIVMIPRISRCFKEGNEEQVKAYIYKSYRYVWMIAIPIMFGLIAVSGIFVPVFFGAGYEKCKILIPVLSILTIFIGLSNVAGMQYFVPTSKQNMLTLTVIIGAVINVVLNAILIPFFASLGAAIASIVAEFCVTLVGLIYIKKKKFFELKPIFTCSFKYWIAGAVMFGVIFAIQFFIPEKIWSLAVLVSAGIVVYFVMLLILRDKMIFDFLSKAVVSLKMRKRPLPSEENTDGVVQSKDNSDAENSQFAQEDFNAQQTGDSDITENNDKEKDENEI